MRAALAVAALVAAACGGPERSTTPESPAKSEPEPDEPRREADAPDDVPRHERRAHGCAFVQRYNQTCSGWQPPVPDPASDPVTRRETARAHFNEGQRFFDLGRWTDAVDAFERAYVAEPLPPILYNIGRAHEHARDLACAAAAYRAYLETRPPANLETMVTERLEDIDERLEALANPPHHPCD